MLVETRLQMCVTHQSCLCLLQYSLTTLCIRVLQPPPSQLRWGTCSKQSRLPTLSCIEKSILHLLALMLLEQPKEGEITFGAMQLAQ